MKLTILAVGKIKEQFYKDAIQEYKKRLSRYVKLELVEVADEQIPEHAGTAAKLLVKEQEAKRLERYLRPDSYLIVLAIDGKQMSSENLAAKLGQLAVTGTSHITFVIGGSLGLAPAILKKADLLLSFSKLTFPHQLMRVILLEQIYRSYRILNHEPYHK